MSPLTLNNEKLGITRIRYYKALVPVQSPPLVTPLGCGD